MKKYFRSNKGLSVMELLVVIGVSAVLISLAALSASILNNANSAKAANALQAEMNKARVQSMAKGKEKGKLTISYSNGVRAKIGLYDEGVISRKRMKVFVYTGFDIPSSTSFSGTRAFDSGAITIEYNTAGMVTEITGFDEAGPIVVFMFKNGKRVNSVVLYTATGKVDTMMWYE